MEEGETNSDKKRDLQILQPHRRSSHSHGHGHYHFHHRRGSQSQDLVVMEPHDNELEKRGASTTTNIIMAGLTIYVSTAPWPSIGRLFLSKRGADLSRLAYEVQSGLCNGRSCRSYELPPAPSADDLKGLESEHPWEVSVRFPPLSSWQLLIKIWIYRRNCYRDLSATWRNTNFHPGQIHHIC